MGTRFDVFLRAPVQHADEQPLDAVAVADCEEIQRLDGVLSRFRRISESARLNREIGVKVCVEASQGSVIAKNHQPSGLEVVIMPQSVKFNTLFQSSQAKGNSTASGSDRAS